MCLNDWDYFESVRVNPWIIRAVLQKPLVPNLWRCGWTPLHRRKPCPGCEFYPHFFDDGWLTCEQMSGGLTVNCGIPQRQTQYITASSNPCSLMKEKENMEQILDYRFYCSWGLLGKSACFRGFSGYCSRNETPLQEWLMCSLHLCFAAAVKSSVVKV